jgi:hypothetical protein
MIVSLYRKTHEDVLRLIEDLSDDQSAWRPTSTALSIGFSLWHLARWADLFQALLGTSVIPELGNWLGPDRQLWEREGLARRWGLDPSALGYAQTGTGTDGEAAVGLCKSLPGKEALLDYARRTFRAAGEAIGAIDEGEFWEPRQSSSEESGGRLRPSAS